MINKIKLSKINSEQILYISILFLTFLTCLPITQTLPEIIRKVLQIIAMFLYVFGIAINERKKYIVQFLIGITLYCFYAYGVSGYKQGFNRCLFNTFTCVSFIQYGLISVQKKNINKEKIKRIVIFLLIIFSITSITTIIGLEKYPLAVRELGRSTSGYSVSGDAFIELKMTYKTMNIATWSILYGMAFFSPQLITLFRKSGQKKWVVLFILCEICIFKAQLTIALLISVFASFLLIYTPSKRLKDVKIFLISFFALLLFVIFSRQLLISVIEFADNRGMGMLSNKLNDLLTLMSGMAKGDAASRFGLYTKSLKLFVKYPILGASFNGVANGSFGEHSEIFDIIGFYGLVGGVLIVVYICLYLFFVKNNIDKGQRWEQLVPFMALIMLLFLNPVWYSPQVYACAIMMPCLINAIET